MSFTELVINKTKDEKCDLYKYADEQVRLEDVIKRANKEGIVFPDLLTCDNTFVSKLGYQFIDYDGIQIGNAPILQISSMLGDDEQYEIPKYMNKNGLYNSNLDKKSLLYLYYLSAFNINLNMVGITNPYNGKKITLDEILEIIGLKNYDLMQATYLAVNGTPKKDIKKLVRK